MALEEDRNDDDGAHRLPDGAPARGADAGALLRRPGGRGRRLDAELATAFRAACAGVEALRATHLRHAARDRCPPGGAGAGSTGW